jgi:hypothetical protein
MSLTSLSSAANKNHNDDDDDENRCPSNQTNRSRRGLKRRGCCGGRARLTWVPTETRRTLALVFVLSAFGAVLRTRLIACRSLEALSTSLSARHWVSSTNLPLAVVRAGVRAGPTVPARLA